MATSDHLQFERRYAEYVLSRQSHCECDPEVGASPCEDCVHRAVSERFIREHPADDGEPIDEEWLRSVGFSDRSDWLCYCDIWTFKSVAHFPGEWAVAVGSERDRIWAANWKTRGDVRRLLAVLGLPLPTPGETR